MNKLIIEETTRLKNPKSLVPVLYNNFLYLTKFPELMHTQDEIYKLLTSDKLLGYLVYHQTEKSKKLIGYMFGEFKNLNDGRYVFYISYIYVMDNYRNKKIGTQLMIKLVNYCKQNSVKFIVLTCDTYDTQIMNFYKKKFGCVEDNILATGGRHEVFCMYL